METGAGKSADLLTSLADLYGNRFNEHERNQKERIWRVLCTDFFQRYVRPSDTVLDVGAGYCEFINNIKCASKIALDLNEDTQVYAAPGEIRGLDSRSIEVFGHRESSPTQESAEKVRFASASPTWSRPTGQPPALKGMEACRSRGLRRSPRTISNSL